MRYMGVTYINNTACFSCYCCGFHYSLNEIQQAASEGKNGEREVGREGGFINWNFWAIESLKALL